VAGQFPGRVRFVVEDFGESPLAERFGIDKYPAVFVGESLVARPEDFYGWGGPATGRYVPFNDVKRRRAFQRDLRRMVELRLEGGTVISRPSAAPSGQAVLPAVTLRDLSGVRFPLRGSGDRPLLIEIWASWCPPCLQTLGWLGEHPPVGVDVVAIAVDSPAEAVAEAARRLAIPGRVAMATKELLAALGGMPPLPTLIVADRKGGVVRTFYGATPDLHEQVEKELDHLRSAPVDPGP